MKQHLNTLLIAFAIILAAYFLGTAFKSSNKTQESIKVTGLGETDFTSNLIVWNGTFSKKNSILKDLELNNKLKEKDNIIKSKDLELEDKNKVIESQLEEINKLKDELTKFKQSLSMLINK